VKSLFFFISLGITILFPWESSKIFIPSFELNNNFNIHSGLDVLELSDFEILKNKNIGLVINHTSVNKYNTHFLDLIKNKKDIKINKIFTPEHGLEGKLSAGEFVKSGYDFENNIEIISLYGKKKKPNSVDLHNLDLVIYDIQDIGSRYYTYISTMTYMMESCAENNLPFFVLDRPNPLGGDYVRGPILELNYSSFVGIHPIPIVHGMTSGELAIMINELEWINKRLDLTIIPVINWQRNEIYDGPMAGWIPPSPNIPDIETVKLYTGLCLLEGTNISEGRGTYSPFKFIGAPFIKPKEMDNFKNKLNNFGIGYESFSFTPISILGMSNKPKFENDQCNGIKLSISEDREYDALKLSVELIFYLNKLYPNLFKFLESNFIDNLYGSDKLRKMIESQSDINILFDQWILDEEKFKNQREKFLIYK
tara:strand:- start:467 stop:1738 length:1272 start_codon:yes stop_codon:yes gene_type:complete